MKRVLVISTALALFAAGGVQTRSRLPLSQGSETTTAKAAVPANASPVRQAVGQVSTAAADRSAASTSAKATTGRGRTARAPQAQTVATSATARDTRVVSTAMLAPAALPSDPHLVSRIQAMLPQGMAADQAAFGFRTQIQFVSAVLAAKNLEVPFSELKTRLLTHGMTLDESIHALRPKVDATAEADRALREADAALSNPE
jgi:hypothetical protein